MKQDYHYSRF